MVIRDEVKLKLIPFTAEEYENFKRSLESGATWILYTEYGGRVEGLTYRKEGKYVYAVSGTTKIRLSDGKFQEKKRARHSEYYQDVNYYPVSDENTRLLTVYNDYRAAVFFFTGDTVLENPTLRALETAYDALLPFVKPRKA